MAGPLVAKMAFPLVDSSVAELVARLERRRVVQMVDLSGESTVVRMVVMRVV